MYGTRSVTAHAQISIMNFITSPKKWSGQNQTSQTGSYIYVDSFQLGGKGGCQIFLES